MSNSLFSEGGLHNISRIGSDRYEFRISIPADVDGLTGRQCTNDSCSPGYFKIKQGTGITEGQTLAFCPYCRTSADPNDFVTKAQLDYALTHVENEAEIGIDRMIQESLGLGASRRKKIGGGMFSIEVKMDAPRSRFIPRPLEEVLRRDIICPNCALEHAVFGIATWCPDCGEDIFLEHVRKELQVIEKVLSAVDSRHDELGARVAARDIENALEDVVSIFEAVLKIITRRHLLQSGLDKEKVDRILDKEIRNRFQNVTTAVDTFKKHVGIELLEGIESDAIEALRLAFEKRHPITHNLGVVDRKYLEKVRTGELEGKEVWVTQQEVQKALEVATAVISQAYSRI